MVGISSWNFVRVPKSMVLGTYKLEILIRSTISARNVYIKICVCQLYYTIEQYIYIYASASYIIQSSNIYIHIYIARLCNITGRRSARRLDCWRTQPRHVSGRTHVSKLRGSRRTPTRPKNWTCMWPRLSQNSRLSRRILVFKLNLSVNTLILSHQMFL